VTALGAELAKRKIPDVTLHPEACATDERADLVVSRPIAAAGVVPKPIAAAGESGTPNPEAEALIRAWAKSQNDGRFDDYKTFYDADFQGARRSGPRLRLFDRAAWFSDRARMFKKAMRVEIRDLRTTARGDHIDVVFTQAFSSGTYSDEGNKAIVLHRRPEGLRIVREEMMSSDLKDAPGAPPAPPAPADVPSAIRDRQAARLKRRMQSPEGDPRPRELALAIGHVQSPSASDLEFDLKVDWPEQDRSSVFGIDQVKQLCVHQVLPAGDEKGEVLTPIAVTPQPDGYVAHLRRSSQATPVAKTPRLRVTCGKLSSAAAGIEFNLSGAPTNAYAVLIDVGRAPAQPRLDELTAKLPAHNDWPRLIESDWIQGLKPGSQVVVIAVADAKKTADALAAGLRAGGISDVAVHPIWSPSPERLHVLIADGVRAGSAFDDGIGTYDEPDAFIAQEGVTGARGSAVEIRVRSAVLDGSSVALPFTVGDGPAGAFSLDFGAAQTECKPVRLKARPAAVPVLTLHQLELKCIQGD
jgi:hypothetical protein